MVVILDTDHLTVIQRRTEPAYSRLRARLSKLHSNAVQTTIVSFEEQMRGWLAVISRAQNQTKEVTAYQRLHALLGFFTVSASLPAHQPGDPQPLSVCVRRY